MRRTARAGSFIAVLLFNILLNFRLTIPGWILLILHFIIPQYIQWWYCLVWFGGFLLYMLIWMLILRALGRYASTAKPAPPKENKNPYSAQSYIPTTARQINRNPCSSGNYDAQNTDQINKNPYSKTIGKR